MKRKVAERLRLFSVGKRRVVTERDIEFARLFAALGRPPGRPRRLIVQRA